MGMGDEEEEGHCEQKGPSGEARVGEGACQGSLPLHLGTLSPVTQEAFFFPAGQ